MKKLNFEIDFKAVKQRIAKEMEGYSRGAWAEKVGVKINVVSNIHSKKSRINPSLNYIIAVSVATGKSLDYYLWGGEFYKDSYEHVPFDRKTGKPLNGNAIGGGLIRIPRDPDLQMAKRIKNWREDLGLDIAQVAKRSGLSVHQIVKLEKGYHTTTDVIVKLADALRCTTDYLLGCGGASLVLPPKAVK